MQTLTIRNSLTSLLLTTSILGACAAFAQDQNYIVPRTIDGQPDLQGLWTNDTITPIERPASMQGREFLSTDEIAAMEASLARRRVARQFSQAIFRQAFDRCEVAVGDPFGTFITANVIFHMAQR